MLKVHNKLGLTVLTAGVCSQLDCSAWQRQIAEALGASPSTPITPSLAHLTALLGPRTVEEEEGYAREANELADQIPVGKLNNALAHSLACRTCQLPSQHVAKTPSCRQICVCLKDGLNLQRLHKPHILLNSFSAKHHRTQDKVYKGYAFVIFSKFEPCQQPRTAHVTASLRWEVQ